MRWLKENDLLLNWIITIVLLSNATAIIYQWIEWGHWSAPPNLICIPLWGVMLLLGVQYAINWLTKYSHS